MQERRGPPGVLCLLDEAPWLCGADARACGAPLQRSPLIFAQTAPDTMILTCFQRPLQACVPDLASPADLLGLFYLEEGRPGIADREEQLRVLIQTGGLMAPIHGVTLLTSCSGPLHKDPAVRGSHESSTLSLDSRPQDFQVLRRNTRLSSVRCLTFRSSYGLRGPCQVVLPASDGAKHLR
jgi:hypothetical protein